ncbi:MAG: hypothetical protein AAF725_10820 [Acidobacteriota bacterium]
MLQDCLTSSRAARRRAASKSLTSALLTLAAALLLSTAAFASGPDPGASHPIPKIAGGSPAAGEDPVLQTRQEIFRIYLALRSYIVSSIGGPFDQGPVNARLLESYCPWAGPAFERDSIELVSHADLEAILVPDFLDDLPEFDAWGHPYEFRLSSDLVRPDPAAVLSPGRDGLFEGSSYEGGFTADPDEDLVLAGFHFVRQPPPPAGLEVEIAEATIRHLGDAFLSWLTDFVGGGLDFLSPGDSVDLTEVAAVPYEEVVDTLIPATFFYYTRCVPERDPWGGLIDYRFFIPNDLMGTFVIVRSAGADQTVEGDVYGRGLVSDPDRDLVWSDGVFFQRPALFFDDFESGSLAAWSAVSGD